MTRRSRGFLLRCGGLVFLKSTKIGSVRDHATIPYAPSHSLGPSTYQVCLSSKTLRECGHSGLAAQCQLRLAPFHSIPSALTLAAGEPRIVTINKTNSD